MFEASGVESPQDGQPTKEMESMSVDAVSAGLSGLRAAETRQRNSAHNVANLQTPDYRNHRTQQVEREGGGVEAKTQIDAEPRPVNLVNEFLEQKLASIQSETSARVINTALETERGLLDILA
jgi:flagellar basal body rod protein FlgG